MKKIWEWCKKEAVLSVAMLLAVISALLVHPDKEYIGYIDFRTLAILGSLMTVMAGLQKLGIFPYIAEKLLTRVKQVKGILFILTMLCFFGSMFITNDVALITFVPFTFIVLEMVLGNEAEKWIVPVVVMQTIAANLGSMLTPIGNPQNLYLYGKAGMGLMQFMGHMLPYTVAAFVLLTGWCIFFPCKDSGVTAWKAEKTNTLQASPVLLTLYAVLFILCLLTVAHVVPYGVTLALVVSTVFLVDKSVLTQVDYSLLLTFTGFFVFIGNMGRIPAFCDLLQRLIAGNEVATAIIASQFISNVPAALLLSGFTDAYDLLMIGTNLGGLGTIIASMASLISFKYIGREYKQLRGKYLASFTLANVLFLAVLWGFYMVLAKGFTA